MIAQTTKIVVLFLFAGTFVSAGGCLFGKNKDGRKKRAFAHKIEESESNGLLKRGLQRVKSVFPKSTPKSKFDKKQKNMDKFTKTMDTNLQNLNKLKVQGYLGGYMTFNMIPDPEYRRNPRAFKRKNRAVCKIIEDAESLETKYPDIIEKYDKDLKEYKEAWETYMHSEDFADLQELLVHNSGLQKYEETLANARLMCEELTEKQQIRNNQSEEEQYEYLNNLRMENLNNLNTENMNNLNKKNLKKYTENRALHPEMSEEIHGTQKYGSNEDQESFKSFDQIENSNNLN